MQQRPSRSSGHASAALPQRPCISGPINFLFCWCKKTPASVFAVFGHPPPRNRQPIPARSGHATAALLQGLSRNGPPEDRIWSHPTNLRRSSDFLGPDRGRLLSVRFKLRRYRGWGTRNGLGYGSSFGQPGYRANKVPGTRYRVPGTGYQVPGTGYRVPGTGYRVPGTGYRCPFSSED